MKGGILREKYISLNKFQGLVREYGVNNMTIKGNIMTIYEPQATVTKRKCTLAISMFIRKLSTARSGTIMINNKEIEIRTRDHR